MNVVTDPLILLAILALVIVISEWLATNTALKHLGTALLVIIFAAIIANVGLIPAASIAPPLYGDIFSFIAPMAIFFLLLEVNLRDVRKAGLPMLFAFILGSAGTVIGVLVASLVINSEASFGELYYAINGMFTGTFIGGSINFNAIALSYEVTKEGALYAGTVVVDNIYTMIWMLVTLAVPRLMIAAKNLTDVPDISLPVEATQTEDDRVSPWDLAILMTLGCGGLAVSLALAAWSKSLGVAIPTILIITSLALILAQLPFINRLRGSRSVGLFGVYLFLAVIGAYAEFAALVSIGELAYRLALFVGIILTVHGLVVFGVGRLFKLDWELLAIASQANVGGQTTAIALCRTFNRPELFLPAILIGSLGSSLGTYLGFLVASLTR
jgi:uncharacterized membrane protein